MTFTPSKAAKEWAKWYWAFAKDPEKATGEWLVMEIMEQWTSKDGKRMKEIIMTKERYLLGIDDQKSGGAEGRRDTLCSCLGERHGLSTHYVNVDRDGMGTKKLLP